MSISAKQKLITVALESTYGTEVAPTGSNAILTSGLTITPYAGNVVSRDFDRTELGNSSQINTGPNVQCSFSVELAGSGTAGTAPGWGDLMLACGMDETIVASTSVTYAPVSTGFDSVTIYYYVGSGSETQLHKMVGARGDVTFELSAGGLPKANFTMTSLYTSPASDAGVTAVLTAFIAPVPVTNTNTTPYTVAGQSVGAETLTWGLNNEVIYRNVVGTEAVLIVDRAPSGSFGIEAIDIDTYDYFSDVESHSGITEVAAVIQHGQTAGNIITFNFDQMQLSTISMGDSDKVLMYNMDAQLLPDSGDDEFSIVLT